MNPPEAGYICVCTELTEDLLMAGWRTWSDASRSAMRRRFSVLMKYLEFGDDGWLCLFAFVSIKYLLYCKLWICFFGMIFDEVLTCFVLLMMCLVVLACVWSTYVKITSWDVRLCDKQYIWWGNYRRTKWPGLDIINIYKYIYIWIHGW
jgi:hypothetical protein